MGTSAMELEIRYENYQIDHTCQNMQQQQTLDQHITSDINPPGVSLFARTSQKRMGGKNALDTEEVETEVFKRI